MQTVCGNHVLSITLLAQTFAGTNFSERHWTKDFALF